MSTVSGKVVFCEGKENSLDVFLLQKVVENLSNVTIVPAGSKFTFSIFAQGYFSSSKQIDEQKYIVFRDRDFDIYPTDNVELIEILNNRGNVLAYSTYRACIENYLLDTKLIHEYWASKYTEQQENPNSKWQYQDSPGITVIADWIESSARLLQKYQAVRWALADLLQCPETRTKLKTTWTGNSGKLPTCLELDECSTAAKEMISQFINAVSVVKIETFEENLQKYCAQFSEENFWSNKDYLIWFHGKDIQKMMQKQKNNYPPLKKKHGGGFFEWAIRQIDIGSHPDLVELRAKIEQL